MAFFWNKNNKTEDTVQPKPKTVSLTKNEELNKKLILRKDLLEKKAVQKSLNKGTARVVFVLDHSGSMRKMYKDGTVQNLLERLFPMAMYFDDNGELDFYWFDTTYKALETVTGNNLENYVMTYILTKNEHFGGTNYAPVMKEIVKSFGKKKRMNIPTFVIFITDGANADKADTKNILTEASRYNIFWKFIGIGKEKFEFLEKLDTLKGRTVDNANFVSVNNLSALSDDQLYNLLLEEYSEWLNACRQNNIPVD